MTAKHVILLLKLPAMSKDVTLLTIGHSNHLFDDFLALLEQHGIEAVVDIRRFPSSRKFPHFNREVLDAVLKEKGIDYHWLEALGGRRHGKATDYPTPNLGIRNQEFRNYADHMLTENFREGVERLLEIAGDRRTAIMCAEGFFWRCHRRLVSDYLLANGVAVQHIFPTGESKPHNLTAGAKVDDGKVTYPAEQPLFVV